MTQTRGAIAATIAALSIFAAAPAQAATLTPGRAFFRICKIVKIGSHTYTVCRVPATRHHQTRVVHIPSDVHPR